jgi:AcrR family transcriptional regulator
VIVSAETDYTGLECASVSIVLPTASNAEISEKTSMISPRDRLWSAALNEFAAHGREGARVDRIAAASSLNKQRIYQYCPEGKNGLFAECVRQTLEDAEKKVPLPESISD